MKWDGRHAAPIHGRENRVTGAVIVFRDVRTARAIVMQMSDHAHHDVPTGLTNPILLTDGWTRQSRSLGKSS
jgi:hypothetical protein